MLTEIVEFSLTSVFILYVADAAAAVRDASKARRKAAKAAKTQAAETQAIPDVCIPDEAIAAPKAPKTKAPKAPKAKAPRYRYNEPEGTQITPGLGTTTPDPVAVVAADWDTSAWVAPVVDTGVEEALELEVPEAPKKARRAARKFSEVKATKTKAAAIAPAPSTRVAKAPKAKAPKAKSPTVAQLKDLCKTHGLKTTGLNKGQLVLALRGVGVEVV